MTDFHVVIPARYASSRLPAKPLADINGRPMIAHAWARATEAGAASVCVATDDERIAEAVRGFGGDVWMTSPEHSTGTDRLAEVATLRGLADDAIVVNLQGDEPCMPASLLATVADALAGHAVASIATLATPIRSPADLFNPNVVKVVVDDSGLAGYFSRAPIPWCRDVFIPGQLPDALPVDTPFLRHLGLYAYRAGVLGNLAAASPTELERAESLEQLRALQLGLRIHVSTIQHAPMHGVDTPEDLERVRRALEGS